MGERLPVVLLGPGSPGERGRCHGEQARERVHRSATTYRWLLGALTGLGWHELRDRAGPYLEAVADFDEALLHELEGLAAGARLGLDEVMLLNARSEVMAAAGADGVGECTTVFSGGCSPRPGTGTPASSRHAWCCSGRAWPPSLRPACWPRRG